MHAGADVTAGLGGTGQGQQGAPGWQVGAQGAMAGGRVREPSAPQVEYWQVGAQGAMAGGGGDTGIPQVIEGTGGMPGGHGRGGGSIIMHGTGSAGGCGAVAARSRGADWGTGQGAQVPVQAGIHADEPAGGQDAAGGQPGALNMPHTGAGW